MYVCNFCEKIFDEPVEVTWEENQGETSLGDKMYEKMTEYRCPHCGDTDIDEYEEDEEEDDE